MKVLDLCAGIGGFSLAATWAGMEMAGQVEIDDWCRRVLAKHWPDVPRMADVFAVKGDEFGPIDLVCGEKRMGTAILKYNSGDGPVLTTLTPPPNHPPVVAGRTAMTNPITDRVTAMYARYCDGLSLSQVAREFGNTRQSVFKSFKRRGLPVRTRPAPLPFVEFNGYRYTLRNTGYLGRTNGPRSLLHRDVWESHVGPIPAGFDIHHRDRDRLNNEIGNLECLPKDEHARRFSTGRSRYTKRVERVA